MYSALSEGWIPAYLDPSSPLEEALDHVGDARDLEEPGEQGAETEDGHRDPHRDRPARDVVLGPGEADVGVLALSVAGFSGSAWTLSAFSSSSASLQGSPQTTRKPIRKE